MTTLPDSAIDAARERTHAAVGPELAPPSWYLCERCEDMRTPAEVETSDGEMLCHAHAVCAASEAA